MSSRGARDNGVSFVAFGVLGRGFLTGALRVGQEFPSGDFRARNPRFQPEAMRANTAMLDGVRRVAERLGATPAQVCVAWVLAQGEHLLPIPGTKRTAYLEENVGGAGLSLDAEALADARRAAARGRRTLSLSVLRPVVALRLTAVGRCPSPHITCA